MGIFDNLFGNNIGKVEKKVGEEKDYSVSGEATVKIEDVYFIMGVGLIPVGTVTSGIFRPGMKVRINGKEGKVKSIEMNHVQLQQATEGQKIGFALSNFDKEDVKKNDLLQFMS